MKKITLLLFIAMLVLGAIVNGQDPQFTQFYASPVYLNPAFTGANVCARATNNYRNQWPGIPGAFVSYLFSFDHTFPEINSGAGLLFSSDKAGTGKLQSTSFSLLYSYDISITRKWAGKVGIQAGQTFRDIDFYSLTFGDQLARGGAPTSVETPPTGRITFSDFASGVLIYSKKYWIGFAAHHINRPNQSLHAEESLLPVKLSIHGGMSIIVSKEKHQKSKILYPAFNYKAQAKFDQLDIGFYYDVSPMVFGAWYRGIPLFKAYQPGYVNHDVFALLVGLSIKRLNIGYSYDMTISRLVGSTGGAHELTLSFQFCDSKSLTKKKKKRIVIPSPKF